MSHQSVNSSVKVEHHLQANNLLSNIVNKCFLMCTTVLYSTDRAQNSFIKSLFYDDTLATNHSCVNADLGLCYTIRQGRQFYILAASFVLSNMSITTFFI